MKRFLVLFALFAVSAVNADTVKGELQFDKKPPFGGIVYVFDSGAKLAQAVVDQQDKRFTPMVVATDRDGNITFKNSDAMDHNIFANDKNSGISFDVGLMPAGDSITKTVPSTTDSMTRISCKIHPKMRGYIASIQGSIYQTFEFDRKVRQFSFELKDVPASQTELRIMMPGYEEIILKLKAGESGNAEIIKKGKKRGTASVSRES